MANEYKLSYTAQEIDEKLGKIDEIGKSNTFNLEDWSIKNIILDLFLEGRGSREWDDGNEEEESFWKKVKEINPEYISFLFNGRLIHCSIATKVLMDTEKIGYLAFKAFMSIDGYIKEIIVGIERNSISSGNHSDYYTIVYVQF